MVYNAGAHAARYNYIFVRGNMASLIDNITDQNIYALDGSALTCKYFNGILWSGWLLRKGFYIS